MSLVFQNIDPPPPSPPSECVLPPSPHPPNPQGVTHLPRTMLGGGEGGRRRVHTRWAERGVGGSIFWKTRDIGLPSYSNNLSTVSKLDRRHPGLRKIDNLLTGGGKGWAWSRIIIRPQESLVLYKSFNTLWLILYI
jgi:hypothetical protein